MKILALGSNLPFGNNSPEQNIKNAYEQIEDCNIKILKKSFIYKSLAYPNKNDPEFCNSAILIETDKDPQKLLETILNIEENFGRIRSVKNSPRTLDIDIISYGDQIIEKPNLKIPHPEIYKRLFVLLPIKDIDENWKHPAHNITVADKIKEFDQNEVNTVKKIT